MILIMKSVYRFVCFFSNKCKLFTLTSVFGIDEKPQHFSEKMGVTKLVNNNPAKIFLHNIKKFVLS